MKMNHHIYEEAMDNVRLSEERGMELLEKAVHRSRQRRQKARVMAAAVAVAFLSIALSINGICYAQTGKNAWEMFGVFFQNTDEGETTEFVEKVRGSGESFTYKNHKFTLEQFVYDKENSELFYSILLESVDGTPLDEDVLFEDYMIKVSPGSGSWGTQLEWGEDKTYCREFGEQKYNYDESGKPIDMKKLEVCINDDEGDYPAIGSFTIKPTGKMKTRYIDVTFMEHCSQKAKITGSGVKLYFDEGRSGKKDIFERLDVVMKDKTVFRGGTSMGRDVIPMYNAKGELLNEEEVQGPAKSDNIRECYEEWFVWDSGDGFMCRIDFPDFVNVDDIDAVYVDNVRVPLE